MNTQEKENSISLSDIIRVLWKNIILLGIITFVITLVGLVYTVGIAKPNYKSSSSIIVAVSTGTTTAQQENYDYNNSLRAVTTISQAIKENKILQPVADKYDMKVTALAKEISVSSSSSSMLITITVVDGNAERAANIANDVANRCIEEAKTDGVFFFATDSISKSSEALVGVYNSPNKKLYVLVSFVLGLVVSFVVIFIKEFMSTKFTTKNEIEHAFQERIIGVMPDKKELESKNSTKEVYLVDPTIRALEPYNKLFTNIKYSNLENPYKVILFSSTMMNELKSTTAANLAYAMARSNQKVVIVDLDIRKPTLHKTFGVERENGVVEYAEASVELKNIIKKSESGVDVITAGKNVINPIAVIETTRVKELFEELRKEYDYIIVDSAPAFACPDGQMISTYCDGVVYNVAINQARKKDILDTVNTFKHVDAHIIGINVTKHKLSKKDEAYYYYEPKTN